jgi:Xaa-Pro aminopeptidase
MRHMLMLLPIAALATPAAAQIPATPPATQPVDEFRIPPELTDPAMVARLGDMMGALSKALLNLPIGEVEAAAEGRPVTPADRNRTVRDVAGRGDPNFEANFQREIAASKVTMQASVKALASAMPAISRAMSEAAREIERAAANLPSPTYPRR